MLIYSFAFCLFCFRQRKLLRGTQIYSRFRYFLSLLFFYGSLNCSLTGQRLPMHPSVLTLLMEPLPRALLASPPGAKKLFWMTSCLIKASDHPSHNVTSCPPFPPTPRTQIQGLAVVRVTFPDSLRWSKAAELFPACHALICVWLLFVLNYTEERLSSGPGRRRGSRQNNENEEARTAPQTLQRLCHAVLRRCIVSLM